MPDLNLLGREIEHMRAQLGRHRKDLLTLQRAGAGTATAEALLARMQARIDNLCAQRDALKDRERAAPDGRSR
jgi:hypothetical protein